MSALETQLYSSQNDEKVVVLTPDTHSISRVNDDLPGVVPSLTKTSNVLVAGLEPVGLSPFGIAKQIGGLIGVGRRVESIAEDLNRALERFGANGEPLKIISFSLPPSMFVMTALAIGGNYNVSHVAFVNPVVPSKGSLFHGQELAVEFEERASRASGEEKKKLKSYAYTLRGLMRMEREKPEGQPEKKELAVPEGMSRIAMQDGDSFSRTDYYSEMLKKSTYTLGLFKDILKPIPANRIQALRDTQIKKLVLSGNRAVLSKPEHGQMAATEIGADFEVFYGTQIPYKPDQVASLMSAIDSFFRR